MKPSMRPTPSPLLPRLLSLGLLVLVLAASVPARGQKLFRLEQDSVPLMRGFSVSFDLVGAAMLMLGDYGQYEGALRLNLHDQWFPIVELGYGKADHRDDVVTELNYKTSAPYGRIGLDFNLLKKKHTANRLFGGFRYAYTSYKVDLWKPNFQDPVWQWNTAYDVRGEKCYQHWLEAVFGVDAQIWGPLHLGWSVRYKRRLFHDEGVMGKTWYVPGYGICDSSQLNATFNVIIDI